MCLTTNGGAEVIKCTVCGGLGHVRDGFGGVDYCEACDGRGETSAERLEAYRLELAEVEAPSDALPQACQECNAPAAECTCGFGS